MIAGIGSHSVEHSSVGELFKQRRFLHTPATSLWLVGLYVGISLLFDGWVLLAISWALRKGVTNV